jgi:sugar lactone lactonase YvrE
MMSNSKPELIFYAGSTLLESPNWDSDNMAVLFVSIEQKCVYYLKLLTGEIKTYYMNDQVGCAVFMDKHTIIAAEKSGIYRIDITTGEKQFLAQLNVNEKLRYNDGILDAKGRFLVGTTGYNCLAENQNFLYSWDGKEKKILLKGTTISNGIDFSKDNKYMYFVDTPTKKVSRYFYDIKTGNILFDKNIISIDDGSSPDGICTDIDDMLWVAQWGGALVSKWNSYTGEKVAEIEIPCKNVSSCCIGGRDMEYLFVSTAKHDDGTISEELAGGLFRIKIR